MVCVDPAICIISSSSITGVYFSIAVASLMPEQLHANGETAMGSDTSERTGSVQQRTRHSGRATRKRAAASSGAQLFSLRI